MRTCVNNIDGSLADYWFIEALLYNCRHTVISTGQILSARPVTYFFFLSPALRPPSPCRSVLCTIHSSFVLNSLPSSTFKIVCLCYFLGAYYYYNTEGGQNYEDTLLRVAAYAKLKDIPYRFEASEFLYFNHSDLLCSSNGYNISYENVMYQCTSVVCYNWCTIAIQDSYHWFTSIVQIYSMTVLQWFWYYTMYIGLFCC